jgi:hypothetical protein
MPVLHRVRFSAVPAVILLAGLAAAPSLAAGGEGLPAAKAPRIIRRQGPSPRTVDSAGVLPLGAERRALLDIERCGTQAAQETWLRAQRLPEGPVRRALEHEATEIKRRARVEFLRSLAGLQRAGGRTTEALRTEAVLARLLELRAAPGRTASTTAPPPGKGMGDRP